MTAPRARRLLQPRFVDFSVRVCRWARGLPRDVAGTEIAAQAVRSALSPAANYAEAQGAESRRDFAHKLQVCAKELRETAVWLAVAERLGLATGAELTDLRRECKELIAIMVASINTAKRAAK